MRKSLTNRNGNLAALCEQAGPTISSAPNHPAPRGGVSSDWKRDRTRFFVDVVVQTGSVRLSALCFFIAACEPSDQHPGFWSLARLGKEIGVSRWRVNQLLDEAVSKRLLVF